MKTKNGQGKLMGWRVLRVVAAVIVLAGACGGAGETDEVTSNVSSAPTATGSPAAEDPVPTPAPTQPPPAATSAPTPRPSVERTFDPLPASDDPCATQPDDGDHEFSFILDDLGVLTEIPLQIKLRGFDDVDTLPALVLDFHSEGLVFTQASDADGMSARFGPVVWVHPLADTTSAPWWSQTPTYNRAVIDQLVAELGTAYCWDPELVIWTGVGQGAHVVTEALCGTDHQMTYAILSIGMHFPQDCDPTRAVPFLSLDVFEFRDNMGYHWDGSWTPTSPLDAERVTVDATPADLDRWAELYGCTDERVEETIPDPGDLFVRDTVIFSYDDCDAPIVAVGVQNGEPLGPDWSALLAADARINDFFDEFLGIGSE